MKTMQKILLFFISLVLTSFTATACSVTNGGACLCADGSDNCALLPDIVIAEKLLLDASENPEKRGELRLSVSTPNIGHGPLRTTATDYYVCGTDTIFSPNEWIGCPNGEIPQQLIKQIIYQKSGSENLSISERWAGAMAFHPTHEHMHVNDWCTFSIRSEGSSSDPTDWPIIAEGRKIGFCLRDSGTCDYYGGHCTDATGQALSNGDFPNFELGGGEFTCGSDQGISVGYSDVYQYWLDDMDIQIPDTVCNGDYFLVVVVDPENHFEESNEDNNTLAIPLTLSKQNYEPNEIVRINGNNSICKGDTLTLSAETGQTFEWSTGETTKSIEVTEAGLYSVTVSTHCQNITSDPVEITINDFNPIEISVSDTVCAPNTATLSATTVDEQNTFFWYDSPTASEPVFTGNTFETPTLDNPQSYYLEQEQLFQGEQYFSEPQNNSFGNSSVPNPDFNGVLIFDAHNPFVLISVKVYSNTEGERLIQLRDSIGVVLQEKNIFIGIGESRISLNFDVPKGEHLQLAAAEFPYLERNNSNVSYPYEVDELLTIKASSFDDPVDGFFYYYFFYNWEIKKADYSCTNERILVEAPVRDCVGVEELQVEEFKNVVIFPNPNKGQFQVQMILSKPQPITIAIFNVLGNKIYEEYLDMQSGNFTKSIGLSHLPTGVYLVEIQTANHQYYTKIHGIK